MAVEAQRALRITPQLQEAVIRLDIRRVPLKEIARQLGLNPRTVRRALKRHYAALAAGQNLDEERARALATYLEVQRSCWLSIAKAQERGRSPAMLYAEIRQAQQRIDALLGLAPTSPDDPVFILAQFKQTVVQLIQAEAPDLAPRLAQRLLSVAASNDDALA